jgi:nucleotide-binding universal stress UspA family protein
MMPQKSPRRRTGEYGRILCPTDFSTLAAEGVEHAARLARRDGAKLVLVHVLPPVTTYVLPDGSGPVLLGLADQWRADAWRQLCGLRDRLHQTGVVTHAILCEGYPADQIARVARRLRCDLILLATRGRPGFFRALVDHSVAAGVVRRAPCAVLAYPSPRVSPAQGRVQSPLKVAA